MAQLDRASDYESEGRRFESFWRTSNEGLRSAVRNPFCFVSHFFLAFGQGFPRRRLFFTLENASPRAYIMAHQAESTVCFIPCHRRGGFEKSYRKELWFNVPHGGVYQYHPARG